MLIEGLSFGLSVCRVFGLSVSWLMLKEIWSDFDSCIFLDCEVGVTCREILKIVPLPIGL